MRVLALTSYPSDAAATRFRVQQMAAPLRGLGIELDVRPLLSTEAFVGLYDRTESSRTAWRLGKAHIRRVRDIAAARSVDVVFLQREAALLGPPVVELILDTVGRKPIVLDLDDPTWIPYDSPTFGRLGRVLKRPGKTDWLIDRSVVVTCGSQAIADHVTKRGTPAVVLPTVVDTEVFRPRAPKPAQRVVVGWVGSHSTAPYLAHIAPAVAEAAAQTELSLLVIGGGPKAVTPDGVPTERRPWELNREVSDFQSLDIGLYPLADDPWARGKSGFKAIQYLACGVPFVVSPVGATCEIGVPGTTHLEARSLAEWAEALSVLAADARLRASMGAAGRMHALANYTVAQHAGVLAQVLRGAA